MDKIYSRKRIRLPKFNNKNININMHKNKNTKIIKIISVIIISLLTMKLIINSISPILYKECINMAKSIATKVSNEQATIVMNNYKYEDLCTITKDNNGNIAMISANIVPINEIISDITLKIQEELDKEQNSKFKIKLGSITGSKLLSRYRPRYRNENVYNR